MDVKRRVRESVHSSHRTATPRRTLVPLGWTHRAALLRSASDPAVGDAMGRGKQSAAEWVEGTIRAASRGRRSGHRCDLAVLDADTSFVGFASVRFDDSRPDLGELAYWIKSDLRGQGYATSASRCLAYFAFETLGACALRARIRPGNAASHRVLAKLGFRSDGDVGCYALSPEDLSAPLPSEGETVLVLRHTQRAAFESSFERRFVRDIVIRLAEAFPATFSDDDDALEADALAAMARARTYSLRQARDLTAFVEIALLVSRRFDEHPAFATPLRDPRVAPDDRMAALFAILPKQVWDEASQLRQREETERFDNNSVNRRLSYKE